MIFNAGMRVEACSWERGYEGAWFEGVIQSCKRDCCELLYEKFQTEDGAQPLVEELSYSQLRPRPPQTNVRNWAIGDLVEAYENDAWWRGVVMKVLPARQYYVEFPESKSDNIFHLSNIRVRQDWMNGKWCLPLPSPSPLQATRGRKRQRSFPSKFPVAKGTLFRESRKDTDNEECSVSIDRSCTAFVHSSPDIKNNMQEKEDRTDHNQQNNGIAIADKIDRTDHNQQINGIAIADEIVHEREVNVYRSVLQVFRARKTISWETDLLLNELRIELHITCDEHLSELKKAQACTRT